VSSLEPFSDLGGVGNRVVDGQRSTRENLGEILAIHEFEDERERPIVLFETVNHRDMSVIQGRDHLRLTSKARNAFTVLRERGGQYLDGYITIEAGVACSPDLSHTARAD
jgi:hypothetical protein